MSGEARPPIVDEAMHLSNLRKFLPNWIDVATALFNAGQENDRLAAALKDAEQEAQEHKGRARQYEQQRDDAEREGERRSRAVRLLIDELALWSSRHHAEGFAREALKEPAPGADPEGEA